MKEIDLKQKSSGVETEPAPDNKDYYPSLYLNGEQYKGMAIGDTVECRGIVTGVNANERSGGKGSFGCDIEVRKMTHYPEKVGKNETPEDLFDKRFNEAALEAEEPGEDPAEEATESPDEEAAEEDSEPEVSKKKK